ncbi:hypothetical protein [Okeania hirsuta]|uniref:hypothetical protein n=1 Tax=Okeania hirsuta TaxID=1458930 RepID=UPI0026A88665
MTIADVATEVGVTPSTPSASDNEMTIADVATVVERRIKSSILDASDNEMTIATFATEVGVTPSTLSASDNEMTIATSAIEVELTND